MRDLPTVSPPSALDAGPDITVEHSHEHRHRHHHVHRDERGSGRDVGLAPGGGLEMEVERQYAAHHDAAHGHRNPGDPKNPMPHERDRDYSTNATHIKKRPHG